MVPGSLSAYIFTIISTSPIASVRFFRVCNVRFFRVCSVRLLLVFSAFRPRAAGDTAPRSGPPRAAFQNSKADPTHSATKNPFNATPPLRP
jgi:hypothetical protein